MHKIPSDVWFLDTHATAAVLKFLNNEKIKKLTLRAWNVSFDLWRGKCSASNFTAKFERTDEKYDRR